MKLTYRYWRLRVNSYAYIAGLLPRALNSVLRLMNAQVAGVIKSLKSSDTNLKRWIICGTYPEGWGPFTPKQTSSRGNYPLWAVGCFGAAALHARRLNSAAVRQCGYGYTHAHPSPSPTTHTHIYTHSFKDRCKATTGQLVTMVMWWDVFFF